jgi:gliding motility-associated-like protein
MPSVVGEKVYLQFTSFNTYYAGNNLGDYVEIFDGTTVAANQLAQITGDFNTSPASNGLRVNAISGIAAVTTPGIFTASNATGALTVRFKNNYSTTATGFSANIKTYKPLSTTPGCTTNLTGSNSTVCPGQAVTLTANGAVITAPLSNNFNSGSIGTGWSSTVTASFANPTCAVTGFDGVAHSSTFLWMSNVTFPRSLASSGLDVSNGGAISFDYRQAIQASASPCEGPDINFSGSTAEGVYLQYSTNGGTSWTTYNYLFPRDGNQNGFGGYYPGTGRYVESWRNIIIPIPAAAATSNTMFRWHQQLGTGATYDNWGLDNIVVSSSKTSTITITNLATGAVLATSALSPLSVVVNPAVTTTYRATITDGISSCFSDFTVTTGNPNATISYPSSPYSTIISTSQPITFSGTTGGTYSAIPAGLTLNSGTGAIMPSTSAAGTYSVTYSIPANGSCPAFSTSTTVVIETPSCGSCSNANCIIGTATNYSGALANHTSNCNTFSPALAGPIVYKSYHSVTVGSSGILGVVCSSNNGGAGACASTRTFKLFPSATPCLVSSGISPTILNANTSPYSNPEWSGITPGTYILEITHNVATACTITDHCQSYYTSNPLGCATCATAACPVSSITTATVALGQTGISTTMSSAGNQLNTTMLPGDVVTICVPVVVPSGSTVLGFKQRSSSSPGGCASPTEEVMTYQLKPANACSGPAIAPNLTNASGVSSGFNPEWNNVAPGNYVMCFTVSMTLFALCNTFDLQNLGYYNVIPPCSNPVITVQPLVTQTVCQNSTVASLTVTATGSTLTYQWFTNTTNSNIGGTAISGASSSTYLPTSTSTGTFYYYCIVYSGACSTKTNVSTLIVSQPPTALSTTPVNATCGNANGTVTLGAVTGGTSPYQYNFNSLGFNGTTNYTNLSVGTYNVIVQDANNCQYTTTVIISNTNGPTALATTFTDASCGNANGTVTLGAVTGGTSPYQYNFNSLGFSATTNYTNLSAGTYSVIVKDANNCLYTTTVNISNTDGPTALATTPVNATCGNANGTVTLGAVTGGTSPYQYNFNSLGFNGTTNYTNLSVGTYNVIVQDANNCQYTTTVTISNTSGPTSIFSSINNILCFNSTGGITIDSVSGGVAPYEFSIDNCLTYQLNNSFNSLTNGNYTICVKDANGCTTTSSFSLTQPQILFINSLVTVNPVCNSLNSGSITINAIGGTGSYTYDIGQGSQISNVFNNLAVNSYTVTVTDINGCITTSNTALIAPILPVIVNTTKVDVTCFGYNNGSIDILCSGGTGQLSYLINPTVGTQNNLGLFSNLIANQYTITVADINGCSTSTIISINQNPEIFVNNLVVNKPTCFGESNGSIFISASGGNGVLNYSLNGGVAQSAGIFTGLQAGNYLISIVDILGCKKDINVVLENPLRIGIKNIEIEDVTCATMENGQIKASAFGGNGSTYTYFLTPGLAFNTTGVFSNLNIGTYTLTVKDSSGCEYDTLIVINTFRVFDVSITKKDLSCYGAGYEGEAVASVIGGVSPYTYNWSSKPAQTSSNATNLVFGYYFLDVIDATGCVIKDTVYINPGECCNEVFIPNAFSPNGDGNNDRFGVTTSSGIELIEFSIFNRWGNKVWSTIDFRRDWDGKYSGTECEVGTYYYIFKYNCLTDKQTYLKKGDLTLVK